MQTLINDAGTEQDQLPRLQHLLVRMWNLANGGRLTLDHYREAGGWDKGLETDLNGVYDALPEPQRVICC